MGSGLISEHLFLESVEPNSIIDTVVKERAQAMSIPLLLPYLTLSHSDSPFINSLCSPLTSIILIG